VSPLESRTPGLACTPREINPMVSSQGGEGATFHDGLPKAPLPADRVKFLGKNFR
jgi:hypothetical protein